MHGHWLLVRLIRTFPDAPFVLAAREALRQSLTAENIVQEAAYLRGEGRASFERPYGLSWLLQLVAEMREWDDFQAREMATNLGPLEQAVLERLNGWLPKLSHPVRIGEHDQSAFALGLMLDYAHAAGDKKFADLIESKARQFYLSDKNCPLAYSRLGRISFLPVLGKQMSCGECCRVLSLPAGSEHSCLKFPRREANGWSPLRPLTPATRSWRI